jgi:fructose-bisphosphate aldolase class II
MPVVSLTQLARDALRERYAVPAINIFNDLTLERVLGAAVQERSPLIVQTSVKTVKSIGPGVLSAMWRAMTSGIEVPVTLHLDHCPERDVITTCLEHGWNSVLFDGSALSVAENQRQTIEVVAEARRYGADVEGEIEAITGVEDGYGSDDIARRQELDVVVQFIEATGVDVFAPSIGNAHGAYTQEPELDGQRISDIVEKTGVAIALHGGSGLTPQQFADMIARGCTKINISTALKMTYMQSSLRFLRKADASGKWDPPSLFREVSRDVTSLAADHMRLFGSTGKAKVSAA